MNISRDAMKAFGLVKHPFWGDCQSKEDIYYSVDHYYVKVTLQQAARVMGSLAAVVGEVGSGKTTIKNDFIEQAEQDGISVIEPFMLDKAQLKVQHIEEAVIYGLAPRARLLRSREARNRQLATLLKDSARAAGRHVLIIEEAQDLSVPVLKVLKRLVEIKAGNKACISVVMIGQPELLARLDVRRNYHLRELINRTTIAELEPLKGEEEVSDYLAKKFQKPAKIFHQNTYSEVLNSLSSSNSRRRISAAYPLAINNLVSAALNKATELGLPQINSELIRSLSLKEII